MRGTSWVLGSPLKTSYKTQYQASIKSSQRQQRTCSELHRFSKGPIICRAATLPTARNRPVPQGRIPKNRKAPEGFRAFYEGRTIPIPA